VRGREWRHARWRHTARRRRAFTDWQLWDRLVLVALDGGLRRQWRHEINLITNRSIICTHAVGKVDPRFALHLSRPLRHLASFYLLLPFSPPPPPPFPMPPTLDDPLRLRYSVQTNCSLLHYPRLRVWHNKLSSDQLRAASLIGRNAVTWHSSLSNAERVGGRRFNIFECWTVDRSNIQKCWTFTWLQCWTVTWHAGL